MPVSTWWAAKGDSLVTGEWLGSTAPRRGRPARVDTSVAHIARVYDYWLGGKDNFAADRAAGDQALAAYPGLVSSVRANRAFLARAVRFLAGEAGIRQFLDIGTGLPTADNTHEVAQQVAPRSRIVYVDNDPMVLAHARALLISTPEGACAYLDGDLRHPDEILTGAAQTLDFSQPVALMLLGVLHHIPGTGEAYEVVRRLLAALAPGSYLAINHSTSAVSGAAMEEAVAHWNRVGTPSMTLRTPQQIAHFFDGLELLPPGVVSCSRWRPGLAPGEHLPAEVDEFCGVARKR
jgi:trans-aconitate methyltransferase